ncbi:hypothetical protein [Paenarthrobacter sp. NPDC058233]
MGTQDEVNEVDVKNRVLAKARRGARMHTPTILQTGQSCSMSGWWILKSEQGTKQFITQGSVMPAHHGMTTSWVLMPATRFLFG